MSVGGFSTRDAAKLVGLSPRQVRAYVHAGFLAPARGRAGAYLLSFQDLVVLRVARTLVEREIPSRRIHRALRAVRRHLGDSRRLSEVRIGVVGGRIVVRDATRAWSPESGQLLLDLDVRKLAAAAAPLSGTERRARVAPDARTMDAGEHVAARFDDARGRAGDEASARAGATHGQAGAEDWYEIAIELEDGDPAAARTAYERAIALDPSHADALIDLGHLLHGAGDAAGAESCYRRALVARPDDAVAAYNLGVALEDLGRAPEAIESYERATQLDPKLPDAYYNLGGLYHELGREQAAIRALNTYRKLSSR